MSGKALALAATATLTAGAYGLRELRKGWKLPQTDGVEDGGKQIAKVLKSQGVKQLFVLSGGHVAPVYVEAANVGIKVIDVRHEASAVFAADATARMTGLGIAVVTAGPGVTNTVTAIQNAFMAESPVVLLGGATSILLKGRGSLQDIDHLAVLKPITKWAATCKSVADVGPTVLKAIETAQSGVPGPVFVELPLDVLYPPAVTVAQLQKEMPKNSSMIAKVTRWYMTRYMTNLLAGASTFTEPALKPPTVVTATPSQVSTVISALRKAKKPVLVIGSGALLAPWLAGAVAAAVTIMGIPTYLAGMGRGLLGKDPPKGILFRHNRGNALKNADVVILAGVVCDFRLRYGLAINHNATLISVNRSRKNINLNRRPTHGIQCDAGTFLIQLADAIPPTGFDTWPEWKDQLNHKEEEREKEIAANASTTPAQYLNPVNLLKQVNNALDDNSIVVADGGDFVGTAAYVLQPRGPLCWLDPGAFGTLGVGGGFAIGAKVCHPDSEVWVIFGDGALGFSIAEFDTMARHKLGVIAVVGNDAVWSQMIRDQVKILNSDAACHLAPTRYDIVCEGFGGRGLLIERTEDIADILAEAKKTAKQGIPVLVNCRIARNDFREGAISI